MKIDNMNGMAGNHQTNLKINIDNQFAATNRTNGYLLEWEHAQALVHSGGVREESGESGFEDETEVEGPVSHSLVDDGITTGLANDQIGPLYDDDRDEESGVAGVLQGLPVLVGLNRGS